MAGRPKDPAVAQLRARIAAHTRFGTHPERVAELRQELAVTLTEQHLRELEGITPEQGLRLVAAVQRATRQAVTA